MHNYRTDFIGYPVDNLTQDELLSFVENAIEDNRRSCIAVQNANKMFLSGKFESLKQFIEQAPIILPENAINIGMRALGKPLKQRNMGGIHTMEAMLDLANQKGYSVSLLGATQNELDALVKAICSRYPKLRLTGWRNGYFRDYEEAKIVTDIARQRPDMLFLGLGSPKQEFFIANHFDALKAIILMGVGGSFKVLAGLEKPAPKWTKYGLEWLYRSILEPSKLKRYVLVNSYFIYRFARHMLSRRNRLAD